MIKQNPVEIWGVRKLLSEAWYKLEVCMGIRTTGTIKIAFSHSYLHSHKRICNNCSSMHGNQPYWRQRL